MALSQTPDIWKEMYDRVIYMKSIVRMSDETLFQTKLWKVNTVLIDMEVLQTTRD